MDQLAEKITTRLYGLGITLGPLRPETGAWQSLKKELAGVRKVTGAGDLASYIDHTLLKPEADRNAVAELCRQAVEHKFCSVCINPYWTSLAKGLLKDGSVKLCTVCGFPLGADEPNVKAGEAARAVHCGADEVDMVINIGALRSGMYREVFDDIAGVVKAAEGRLVKVIIETCLLNDEQKIEACLIAKAAGAHFVKTSTGFSSGGATAADVALMRKAVGPEMGVKASGGIKTAKDAMAMVQAGANRIGTSSGISIISK